MTRLAFLVDQIRYFQAFIHLATFRQQLEMKSRIREMAEEATMLAEQEAQQLISEATQEFQGQEALELAYADLAVQNGELDIAPPPEPVEEEAVTPLPTAFESARDKLFKKSGLKGRPRPRPVLPLVPTEATHYYARPQTESMGESRNSTWRWT